MRPDYRQHRIKPRRVKPIGHSRRSRNWTKGFSLCFRSHQMLIVLLRSRHGFRTVPGDVRELLDLGKLVSIAVRQAGGPVFGSN